MGTEYICFRYCPEKDNVELSEITNQIKEKKLIHERKHFWKFIYNAFVSQFHYRIFSISDENGLIHYSFLISTCSKFSFLKNNDVLISPSWTRDDMRGRGIMAQVYSYISREVKRLHSDANIYVLVREENESSMRGMKKSAFQIVGKVEKTNILKKYGEIY